MVKCPGCSKKVIWDWCGDQYIVNGKGSVDTECVPEGITTFNTIRTMQCPWCNVVLGASFTSDEGETIFNHPAFKDVEW